jgi:U4/U6.U5 tri-snRNP-associated protein 2
MMTKRQAEDPLQDVSMTDSPASKKARLEAGSNGGRSGLSSQTSHATTNGNAPGSPKSKPANTDNTKPYENAKVLGEGEWDDEDQEKDESRASAPIRQIAPTEGYTDLYLDTINRRLLDFDFEKLCSVTLSNINVYACLVCGKYYQGRGHKSQAYFHALEVGHHVYINMETKRVYVLPEEFG